MHAANTLLVTGAAGKVGQTLIRRLLDSPAYANWQVRALCHRRGLAPAPRLEVVYGAMDQQQDVANAVAGATHVVHLATCKEIPQQIMDVAVKGLFWLLEACRQSPCVRQAVLIGGDAAVGHFFYPQKEPVTEETPHRAYPGCYALSKVLEEVMAQQYHIQYELNTCCLRAPWIMEKDDFKYSLSFGEDVFGGPHWRDLAGAEAADGYIRQQAVPVALDAQGVPLQRNFIHAEDLVSAILLALDHPQARGQLFNISMDAPVDYGQLGAYLQRTRGMVPVPVPTPYYSVRLSNAKAKRLLGWQPAYDMHKLADSAFDYVRAADDPRVVYYPG